MRNNLTVRYQVRSAAICATLALALAAMADAQSPPSLPGSVLDVAAGKSSASVSTVPAVATSAATTKAAPIVASVADGAIKKEAAADVATPIMPKGKRMVALTPGASSRDAEVVAPGSLTRKQDRIDELAKDDEIAGKQLSIAGKQKQRRQLLGEENTRMRGDMKVIGIEGQTSDLIATLRYASGEELEVRAGDTLPDGKTVRVVRSTGLTLVAGKVLFQVPLVVASGRATAARGDALPQERVFVPLGGAIPAPSALNR